MSERHSPSRDSGESPLMLPDWQDDVRAGRDEPQQQNLWHLVTDRMAGRWKYAVPLAILLAGGLAFAGYHSTEPKYESSGIIRVAPRIAPVMRETPETGVMPFYTQFVQSQAQLLQSHRVLDRAVQSLDLSQFPWQDREEALRDIRRHLSARADRQSELISVTFQADSGRIAQEVLNAVLTAYDELYGSVEGEDVRRKMQALNTNRSEQRNRLSQVRNEIQDLIASTGYAVHSFSNLIEQRASLIFEYEAELRQLRHQLEVERDLNPEVDPEGAETASETDRAADDFVPSEEQLRQFDPELERLFRLREDAQYAFEEAQQRFTERHYDYRQAQRRLERREEQYREQLEIARFEFLALGDDAFEELGEVAAIPVIRRRIELLEAEVQQHRESTRELSELQLRIDDLRTRESSYEQELNDISRRIRELDVESESVLQGRISIAARGDRPSSPNRDQRLTRAAMGAVAGFGTGFGLLFLLGTIDRRAYTAGQIAHDSQQLRLLGILPALPKKRADMEESAVAAHCVHQIRNQLESMTRQIKGSPVIAVTSAYQGDGKTSLTLALGASYAASGYRTVLVDTDLVGQSLTQDCRLEKEAGLKEYMLSDPKDRIPVPAVAAGALDVVPVGTSNRFGPESIRRVLLERMLDDLRGRYEIILLDTGPFPGSIESLPVATAADGVLFTLWRGRRWTRLRESVELLRSSGGTCLGLVLNYARASDCDYYVSKSSVSQLALPERRTAAAGTAPGAASVGGNGRPPVRPRNVLMRAMEARNEGSQEE